MKLAVIIELVSAAAALPTGAILRRDSGAGGPAFDYENDKIRGVNLGGWFLLEPYMNPTFFSEGFDAANLPVDEFHLTQMWGKEKSQEVLSKHWDSWIQESDFENIASWGMNFVRIPIGYWAFLSRVEDPYVQGQVPYLDRAIGWARNHNIKVWIDLHGVPGSQNGFDNSGLRDSYEWQNPEYHNMQDTYTVLQAISERYAGPDYYDVVIGIELVNEPLGAKLDTDKLHDFYNKGYDIVRDQGTQNVIVHDAYEPVGFMDGWLNTPDYWNVVLDHHQYQVFNTWQLQLSIDDHVKQACDLADQFSSIDNKWHLVGEWSAALTDCSPLVNGVYIGSRYDGSYENTEPIGSCAGINDISQWSDEQKQNTRRYVEAQLDSFEHGGAGWAVWAYKTENSIEWDLSRLIEYGLFPNPVTDRQYPNQCGF